LPLFAYLFVKKNSHSKILSFLFSAIIAFNPYNIHYSRQAWESNILTIELLLAAQLFFNKKYSWSSLIFGLSLYTYQTSKLISLLLIIVLFIVNFSKDFFSKKFFIRFFLPLIIFTLPLLYSLLFQSAANRFTVLSLFSHSQSLSESTQIIKESDQLDFQLFHNQYIYYVQKLLSHYFNYFSPKFLLTEGDWQNPENSAPYTGVLLLPSIIFLIIGLFKYLTDSKKNSLNRFFFFWLLLAPIPAALTEDTIHATRAMSFSLPLCYFAALGLSFVFSKFKNLLFISIIFICYSLSLFYYLDLYYNHMLKKKPQDWNYGYQSAVEYVTKYGQNKIVYFTPFYSQPYIYYLFYNQYEPQKYQAQANLINNGHDIGSVEKIDNIIFETPNFNYLKTLKQPTLAIFSYDDAVRQGIDLNKLTPLSPINNISTFYAYKNP
jgi:hypothetical protein